MPLLTTPGHPLAAPALAALGSLESRDSRDSRDAPGPRREPARSPPPEAALPARVFVGANLAGARVLAIEPARPGHRLTLGFAGGASRLELRVRPHDPSMPFTLRIAGFAIDVADPAALDGPAREAIRALVQALAPAKPR